VWVKGQPSIAVLVNQLVAISNWPPSSEGRMERDNIMIDDVQLLPFVQISKTGCHVDILRKHSVFVSRLYSKSLLCEQRLSHDKLILSSLMVHDLGRLLSYLCLSDSDRQMHK